MRYLKLSAALAVTITSLWISGCAGPETNNASRGTTVYSGARLLTGDGSVIENAVFIVENGRFTRVGRDDGSIPTGATRGDLGGKTVIPGLLDAHSHIGYMKNLTSGPQNYTRENILDHMNRFAYFGVAASMAMGTDFGELPYELRAEMEAGRYPVTARFLTTGKGLAPIDEIRPDNMRHSATLVTTPEDARREVRALAARNIKIVKTWVDSRGGSKGACGCGRDGRGGRVHGVRGGRGG